MAGTGSYGASTTDGSADASSIGPERLFPTSRGISASAAAAAVIAAAPYCVADAPIPAASGPATRAPTGIPIIDPSPSYPDTRASFSAGILAAMVTVQTTDIVSMATPSTNEVTQIIQSGSSMASESGETAIAAPIRTTYRIGRPGVQRSEIRPPTIRPVASAAEMRPQAAAPPRCAFATAGPSTRKPPAQAGRTTANCSTRAPSQACDPDSDQPSRTSRIMLGAPSSWAAASGRSSGTTLSASSSGTGVSMPTPQTASAQPAPNSA